MAVQRRPLSLSWPWILIMTRWSISQAVISGRDEVVLLHCSPPQVPIFSVDQIAEEFVPSLYSPSARFDSRR
ncbi:hypothetical protein V1521DRAFT_431116 [Lipomyces starkeyi]